MRSVAQSLSFVAFPFVSKDRKGLHAVIQSVLPIGNMLRVEAGLERVVVLDRVPERHPEVSKEDAEDAWCNCLMSTPAFKGDPDRYLAVGVDGKGRLIELVVVRKPRGLWLVIHAQTPPQEGIRKRLGIDRRKS